MNSIASFRLCTLSDEELLQKVDTMTDEMYQTGKIPDRQIPARPNGDYDLLIGELLQRFNQMLQSDNDTSKADSSNGADPIKSMFQKITCNGCREMTEERFVQAVEELNHFTGNMVEAFKEELEKQYPLQGMKPNRFRQQGANWSFTNYTQPLLSELAEAKKEIERLKSQLDGILKQEFGE